MTGVGRARRWLGLAAGLWLVAGGGELAAQAGARDVSDPPPAVRFQLREPTPNPFRDRVEIPFVLGEGAEPRWRTAIAGPPGEEGRSGDPEAQPARATVSIRIYNLLHQNVAWAREAPSPDGTERRVRDVSYAVPGHYTAVWDGHVEDGYRAPPGPYFVELVVEGWTAVRKVLLER